MRSRRKAKVSRSGWSRRVTLPIADANVYVGAPLLARVLHFQWSTEGLRTRKLLNKILQIKLKCATDR
jgi:hypothetical protein